jgi:hypothetical protein
MKDPTNFRLATEMTADVLAGRDPLSSRVLPVDSVAARMLGETEDVFVEGVQMAVHGHDGVNGMRGSPSQFRRHLRRGMSAHAHTAGIRGRWFTVGHSSTERHGYNKGPSTWSVTHGVVYPGGQCSLMTCIDGRSLLSELPEPTHATVVTAKKSVRGGTKKKGT